MYEEDIIKEVLVYEKDKKICAEIFPNKQFIERNNIENINEKITHKYMSIEKKKRYYDSNILLTCSEIHTIDAIGSNYNVNITHLASLQGVTKGAVSQMVHKHPMGLL